MWSPQTSGSGCDPPWKPFMSKPEKSSVERKRPPPVKVLSCQLRSAENQGAAGSGDSWLIRPGKGRTLPVSLVWMQGTVMQAQLDRNTVLLMDETGTFSVQGVNNIPKGKPCLSQGKKSHNSWTISLFTNQLQFVYWFQSTPPLMMSQATTWWWWVWSRPPPRSQSSGRWRWQISRSTQRSTGGCGSWRWRSCSRFWAESRGRAAPVPAGCAVKKTIDDTCRLLKRGCEALEAGFKTLEDKTSIRARVNCSCRNTIYGILFPTDFQLCGHLVINLF